MTSYGGIIRIRCRNCPKQFLKGRSSRTPSQPAFTSSLYLFVGSILHPSGIKCKGFLFRGAFCGILKKARICKKRADKGDMAYGSCQSGIGRNIRRDGRPVERTTFTAVLSRRRCWLSRDRRKSPGALPTATAPRTSSPTAPSWRWPRASVPSSWSRARWWTSAPRPASTLITPAPSPLC